MFGRGWQQTGQFQHVDLEANSRLQLRHKFACVHGYMHVLVAPIPRILIYSGTATHSHFIVVSYLLYQYFCNVGASARGS